MRSMTRWTFIVVALFVVFGWGEMNEVRLRASMSCAPQGLCSEEGQFCGETHELICGYPSECCGGICDSPEIPPSGGCDNDNNQCKCDVW